MNEILPWVWNYEIRLLPILTGILIFALLHYLRKLTKIEYTPSYFAIFPLSTLEYQLSLYFNEFYGGEYQSRDEGRPKSRHLFLKAWISFFLTFLLVPLFTGFLLAFLLRPDEFIFFQILLFIYEGRHCLFAMYDFYLPRGEWKSVLKFFVPFYSSYLFFLILVIRLSYHFARPFIEQNEISGLLQAIESNVVQILVYSVLIAVIANLLSNWMVNKDAIRPPDWSEIGDEPDLDDE